MWANLYGDLDNNSQEMSDFLLLSAVTLKMRFTGRFTSLWI